MRTRPVRRRTRLIAALGAVAALGVTVLAPAASAEPPPVQRCSDLGPAIWETSVDGDLLVDVGCDLWRSSVRGDVTVVAGVELSIGQSGVSGDVRSAGSVWVGGSRIEGDVVLDGLDTAALEVYPADQEISTFVGDVTGRATDVRLAGAVVEGAYDVTVRDATRIRDRSRLVGPATARGGRLLVHDATFLGGLTSTGSGDSIMCRATIFGDLRVTGLTDYARLGVEGDRMCRTSVSGSVVLQDNPHSIDLGRLEVAGDLRCTGNTGPRGITFDPARATRVHGVRTGQCAP
jgi:hypothetical protein